MNARASILAAANPIYGRYDRTKTLKANVALSAPILSRFDLFFVVLDDCNPESDRRVAQHILNVHRSRWNNGDADINSSRDDTRALPKPPFTKEQMQRYIRFCRTINPKITAESQRVLVDCYRKLRQGDTLGRNRSAYRITVRQLESMIRLSEAMARLHCDAYVQIKYVREAFRLLKTSVIQVESSELDIEDEDGGDDDDHDGNNGGAGRGFHGNDDDGDDDGGDDGKPSAQRHHPGEYQAQQECLEQEQQYPEPMDEEDRAPQGDDEQEGHDNHQGDQPKKSRKRKHKTKISYEEYERIATAIASHLRSLELEDGENGDNNTNDSGVMKWSDLVEWYLEQMEQDFGDSLEELNAAKKKVNLVIRRLVNVDMVLIALGGGGGGNANKRRQEQETKLAVHPNYDPSS